MSMKNAALPVRVNLKYWRDLRDMTQAELADLANVRRATISELENGKAKGVSFNVLGQLARALGVHVSQLFTDAPKKQN